MCINCNCITCKNERDTLLVSQINEKFQLDISCCYQENDMNNIMLFINNIKTDDRQSFLEKILSECVISLVQMSYSNSLISADVAHYLLMCNQTNKENFFEQLTQDCTDTDDECIQYLTIFKDFIKTYYNISENMFTELCNMINTHTIKFTQQEIVITAK
jgi:hypothetical protein